MTKKAAKRKAAKKKAAKKKAAKKKAAAMRGVRPSERELEAVGRELDAWADFDAEQIDRDELQTRVTREREQIPVELLEAQLASGSERAALAAALLVRVHGVVEPVLAFLRDGPADSRASVAVTLGEAYLHPNKPSVAATRLLIELAADNAATVRAAAVEGLSCVRSAAAWRAIATCARDPQPRVRIAALHALVEAPERWRSEPLLQALHTLDDAPLTGLLRKLERRRPVQRVSTADCLAAVRRNGVTALAALKPDRPSELLPELFELVPTGAPRVVELLCKLSPAEREAKLLQGLESSATRLGTLTTLQRLLEKRPLSGSATRLLPQLRRLREDPACQARAVRCLELLERPRARRTTAPRRTPESPPAVRPREGLMEEAPPSRTPPRRQSRHSTCTSCGEGLQVWECVECDPVWVTDRCVECHMEVVHRQTLL